MRYDGLISFDRALTFAQAQVLLPHMPPIAKINNDGKSITIKGDTEELDLSTLVLNFYSLGIMIIGLITAYNDNNRIYDLIIIKNQIKKFDGEKITTILP